MPRRQGSRPFGWSMEGRAHSRRSSVNPGKRMLRLAATIGGATLVVGLLGLTAEYIYSSKEGKYFNPAEGENCSLSVVVVNDGEARTLLSSIEPNFSMDVINTAGEGASLGIYPNGRGVEGRDSWEMRRLNHGQPAKFNISVKGSPLAESFVVTLAESLDGRVEVDQQLCSR